MPKKRNPDPKIIRVGDLVRIINPVPVIRVGYPKTHKDYLPDAEKAIGNEVDKILGPYYRHSKDPRMLWLRKKILSDIAYIIAGRDGLGGNERQIFFEPERKKLKDKLARVVQVRIAKTGTYFSPTSYSCPYTGEYDYDCGGLENEKTHKLVTVDFFDIKQKSTRIFEFSDSAKTFLATDVEKVFDTPNNKTIEEK